MNLFYLLLLFLFLNIRAYTLMILDKRKAIKQKWRTPESKLYLAGLLGGFVGIWAGMLPPVNHKKSKSGFVFRIFLYTIANIIVCYFIYDRFGAYLFWDIDHLK